MKILHVVDQINHVKHGGPAQVALHLAQAQARLGHEVTIFASDHEAKEQQAPEGVKLYKFNTLFTFKKLVFTPGMYFKDYRHFDIVHLHNYRVLTNIIACDSFRGAIILQAHGNCQPVHRWHDPVWRNLIFKKCARYIADADAEIWHYLKEGANPQKIVSIPVGIDTAEFNVTPERNGHKMVLYLGRLAEIKGLDILLKAFKNMNYDHTRLVLAGPDYMGYEAKLREMVRRLNLENRVVFLGQVDGRIKANLYASADVYVLPSRYEMWGLTFMEALATGTPVILSENCGAATTLPRECGTVVPLDEMKLAQAMRTMLINNYAQFYRDYRKKWVARYDWQNIAKETLGLYKEVLTERCIR